MDDPYILKQDRITSTGRGRACTETPGTQPCRARGRGSYMDDPCILKQDRITSTGRGRACTGTPGTQLCLATERRGSTELSNTGTRFRLVSGFTRVCFPAF
jgi:hypothetical protein